MTLEETFVHAEKLEVYGAISRTAQALSPAARPDMLGPRPYHGASCTYTVPI